MKDALILFRFSLILTLLYSLPPLNAKVIEIWTYYSNAAFSLDNDTKNGLTYDFSNLLTKKSKGKFKFKANYLPRKRINMYLKSGKESMIIWVNPLWFGDEKKEKFTWSNGPLRDKNDFIRPEN